MIYSFMYVLVMSFAIVLIQKLDMSVPPLVSLLVTASIASFYFNIINWRQFKKMYSDCFSNKKQWFFVMFIVLFMWGTSMIGPGELGASLFNFIYFAWLGVLGLLMQSFQNWQAYRQKFYFGICLLLLIAANVYFELCCSYSIRTLYGILLAFFGGTASYVYFKQSQSLATRAQLSATEVLAVRFYLSIFVLIMFFPPHQIGKYFTFLNLIDLVVLACCSLIIPLYFSQKALEKISPEQHAIINSMCPMLTGILQEIVFKDLKVEQMGIYVLYALAFVGFYFINKMRRAKLKLATIDMLEI